jgi:hypothetical protein
MPFAVTVNALEKVRDLRKFTAERRQIVLPFFGATLLLFKIGSQVKPAVLFFGDVDRNYVRNLFAQVFYFRANRFSVFLLFRSDADKRFAKLRIMDFFGMLAVTHGMLAFSDIAMAQDVQNGCARFGARAQPLLPTIRPIHLQRHNDLLFQRIVSTSVKTQGTSQSATIPWIRDSGPKGPKIDEAFVTRKNQRTEESQQ